MRSVSETTWQCLMALVASEGPMVSFKTYRYCRVCQWYVSIHFKTTGWMFSLGMLVIWHFELAVEGCRVNFVFLRPTSKSSDLDAQLIAFPRWIENWNVTYILSWICLYQTPTNKYKTISSPIISQPKWTSSRWKINPMSRHVAPWLFGVLRWLPPCLPAAWHGWNEMT